MRLRVVVALVVAFALGAGGVALGQHEHMGSGGARVKIDFADYTPAHLDVLTGDDVTWTNTSSRKHTVTAEDQSFDSGKIAIGQDFSHTFASPGVYSYYCRLHPTIRGEVDAHDLLLDPQPEHGAPGRSYPIGGRSSLPAGSPVSLEADSGSGYEPVGSGETVGEDGSFSFDVTPSTTTRYRAVSGSSVSPPVELVVVDQAVRVMAARHGRAVVVTAIVTPRLRGGHVVLQVDSRERFGWWPTRRARLVEGSRARFVLHTRRRVRARVALTRSDWATVLAVSKPVVVQGVR
jgi:plastocyanin